jgi:DNA topoisomerase I
MKLFVVESPGKITKISKILGEGYVVKASRGHFRDLDNKKMSIDIDNDFAPIYVITKPDVARELKRAMNKVDCLYIASDLDMEGEAIGQHIYDYLQPRSYKRVVFNAITRDAILKAIKVAGELDQHLVDAQKARRILDRLFGYMISPVLQRRLGGKLSAGRVQSVAAKIILDKEDEIISFVDENENASSFRVTADFQNVKCSLHTTTQKTSPYKSILTALSKPNKNVKKILGQMRDAKYRVVSVKSKESIRNPSPPFETSTLQQEANRRMGLSVKTTMDLAQLLYNAGYITYMRTDSLSISKEGHKDLKSIIKELYGKSEYQYRQYETKSSGAQEAHEAIRPTDPSIQSLKKKLDNPVACRLYRLIWQRTVASQMKAATVDVCTIQIEPTEIIEYQDARIFFQSQIEKIIDPGFMAVYVEALDEEEVKVENDKNLKPPEEGARIKMTEITAKEEYARAPPRYTEATMIKTLQKLGIGRPSTYVNTIKHIINRGYVELKDVKGVKKTISIFSVKADQEEIECQEDTVYVGQEKKKLCPTPLGRTVTEYLAEHFVEMMNYQFTAKMESELDAIAKGEKRWTRVVGRYYARLKPVVDELMKAPFERPERYIGKAEGIKYYALKTKYGPAVKKDIDPKPVYASITEPLTEETINLKEALKLFVYPKALGEYKGEMIELLKGKYGFYFKWNGNSYQTDNGDITLEESIVKITEAAANNFGIFELSEGGKKITVTALKGQYGNYLKVVTSTKKWNCPIPRGTDPKKLTKMGIKAILQAHVKKKRR